MKKRITPTRGSSRNPPRSPSEAEREQAHKDYKITIEYKNLKQHAPSGVYLIPSLDNLRLFYGVIFVRRGPFTNGIFKFQIRLPERYNDVNTWPQITFSSYVYNPYVNAKTGELDIQSAYPSWDPHKHYLVTVLTHLKKIFYMKSFGLDAKENVEARELAQNNPGKYEEKVNFCVKESQRLVYVNDPGCTTKFTEDASSHKILRELLFKKIINSASSMTRSHILDIVEDAHDNGSDL